MTVTTFSAITGITGTANQIAVTGAGNAKTLALQSPNNANNILISDVSTTPIWSTTLPTTVQNNITTLNAVTVNSMTLGVLTMTGTATLNADPINALEAATKQYVDAALSSGSSLTADVTQAGHGFSVGDVIYMQGAGTFAKAQANAASTAESVGIVTVVTDINTFTYTFGGLISVGLAGLTPGDEQYLSTSVAGDIQTTEPSASGHVIKQLMVAISATTALWVNNLGIEIE